MPIQPLAAEPLRDLIADHREESWDSVSSAFADFSEFYRRGMGPAVVAPRLMRALEEVEARARDEALTLDMLASSVALSPSRLCTLFRQQAELSFRQYRRWIRLWLALLVALDGVRLRDAAHEVGFADQAHFSRTCRASFGLSPADLVRLGSACWGSSGALSTASAPAVESGAARPDWLATRWLPRR
jgi:AraC-like DNA-binding protein